MSQSYSDQLSAFIKEVISHIPEKTRKAYDGKKAPDVTRFIRQYFAHVPIAELSRMGSKTACMRALSSWSFVQERKAGSPSITIYSPSKKTHGWETPYTILHILQDDMPFLVDSLTGELARQGYTVNSCLHPIIRVKRGKKGEITSIAAPKNRQASADEAGNMTPESIIDFEISSPGGKKETAQLEKEIKRILNAVSLTVDDWQAMDSKLELAIERLNTIPVKTDKKEAAEAHDFLQWLGDNHFIFLGYIEHDFNESAKKNESAFTPVKNTALGVLKLEDVAFAAKALDSLPPETRHFLDTHHVIEVTKANHRSLVHRPVHMDLVTIKRFSDEGKVIGERRFLGLFTSNVYYEPTHTIPLLRRKIQTVVDRAGFNPKGHDGKALATILEFFPRDELFQISEEQLFEISMGVLSLEVRPRTRMFTRRDRFNRFISCLVYVPRERYSTELRVKIQGILEEAFHCTSSAFYTALTESPMARLHLIMKNTKNTPKEINIKAINARLAEAVSAWSDSLLHEMNETYGTEKAEKLFRRYAHAFPDIYTSRYSIAQTVSDIGKIEQAIETKNVTLDLYGSGEENDTHFYVKIYNPNAQIPLSDILPMLENMGLKVIEERPSRVTPHAWPSGVWIREFRVHLKQEGAPDVAKLKEPFEEALLAVWAKHIDNDPFNQLVTFARMHWRDIILLRAYCRYMKQIRFTYSEDAIEDTIARHPDIARLLVRLFYTRFDPALKNNDAEHMKGVLVELEHALSKVSGVIDDRILRRYSDLMQATNRTNFFQKDKSGESKHYFSFKLNPTIIPDIPQPRPFAEIFVYSRRVEGVHLRGGKVARGGLRWSDRHQDYRTEVLGLMKAQMVKNAVIVPEGSKGGFILKQAPTEGGREALQEEAIACYKTYLSGLLDITDNLVKGKIKPPKLVVRHDGDDPYLVVAADKGTATFSDTANGISEKYGFWLGDAFASGGSAGYDHKKMGITAKGAWVAVQRHFFEMGKDIQKEDFSVIGIGDMSGDVFGNGMLLSKHIKLVGAFNHLHIFFDPDPDPAASFKERKRLFKKPRSGWPDYNTDIMSKGSAIFDRSAKSIKVTKALRDAFLIDRDTVTPDDLIQYMLKAPVELLWNGGIGTYVKAADETHDEVGDRANDSLRVDGKHLGCKVVGEGGNLGLTQRGRIEYALAGGRLNTDAIDNSAGVDCSDHEVNIKITLNALMKEDTLSRDKRDTLLESMTDSVEDLVLRDNYQQTQAITIAEVQGVSQLESQARVMRMLEREGMLNRSLEFLPDDETLTYRQNTKTGLVRPELALLLSYSKLALYRSLLPSNVPDDSYFDEDLKRYFPDAMQNSFTGPIQDHPLRREIIATVISNSIVNRIGSTFFFQVKEDIGVHECDIARGYIASRDSFNLRELWLEIEQVQGKASVEIQVDMFQAINHLVYRTTLWFLRNTSHPLNISKIVEEYQEPVTKVTKDIIGMLRTDTLEQFKETRNRLKEANVPAKLAEKIATLPALASACDIAWVSGKSKLPVKMIGEVYFELSARLKLGWLRQHAESLDDGSHWARLASTAIINDLYDQQRRLTSEVVKAGCKKNKCDLAVDGWVETHGHDIGRYMHFIDDLTSNEHIEFSMLVVALRKLEGISAV